MKFAPVYFEGRHPQGRERLFGHLSGTISLHELQPPSIAQVFCICCIIIDDVSNFLLEEVVTGIMEFPAQEHFECAINLRMNKISQIERIQLDPLTAVAAIATAPMRWP